MGECFLCPSRSACRRHGCRLLNDTARRKIETEEAAMDQLTRETCGEIQKAFRSTTND